MKNLRFKKLHLLSQRERAARVEAIHPDVTVVLGGNDTGKSHFIKSLYGTFGAEAAVLNDRWLRAGVLSLLDFSVDDAAYTLLRVQGEIALFDADGRLLWSATTLVSGVGPKVAELLDFALLTPTRQGDLIIPPPQFCFLPFYQDQDRGWSDDWASFKNVRMVPDFKRSVLEYHTGIRPREYYIAKADKANAARLQGDLRGERRALDRATERLRAGRRSVSITYEPEKFAEQIDRLLRELNELQSAYDAIKVQIADLQSRRAVLVEEIEIASAALSEIDRDWKFLASVSDVQVICPTCSTVHENDFANRFGLIADADACRGFLATSRQALIDVEDGMGRHFGRLRAYENRISQVRSILETTRGEIKLRDMLENESERILDSTIDDERALIDKGIGEWRAKEMEADGRMRLSNSPKRTKEIIGYYGRMLRTFAHELGVSFSDSVYRGVAPKINETGSYGPRAVLAYHYAVLHTIQEFTTSCLCPVVPDTPLQQDQDTSNAERMLSFALANRLGEMQLVLGTVSLHGVEYGGATIEPREKFALLSPGSYEEVSAHFSSYLDQLASGNQQSLL